MSLLATQPSAETTSEDVASSALSVLRCEFPDAHIDPATAVFGANLTGVDLGRPLSPEVGDALRALWLHYRVLFCRDQPIDREQHLRLARIFGDPIETSGPMAPEGYPGVTVLSSDQVTSDAWHADQSWTPHVVTGIVLRSVVVPAVGGDTLWADSHRAYDTLPEDLKERIEGLYAIHDPALAWLKSQRPDLPGHEERVARVMQTRRSNPLVAHPLVRVHPESGRKLLFVSEAYCASILDLEPHESARLLARLLKQFVVPENQVRFRWSANAVVMWDNRATQHYATWDYGTATRVMERVAVQGDHRYW